MRPSRFVLFLPAATVVVPCLAVAQTTYPSPYPVASPYAVQPLSNADLLAEQVRALAADPTDLSALIRAGELAVKLGDGTAAAAFFARAARIDPRNPRIKSGEGSLLVAAERPGEALRRFSEAVALGGDVRSFAADRGLAYDLIGEQERAQRDYRVALRGGADDETQRRYALSLGIAGKRDLALTQLEPLLRRSDRGAWRARAFILAMNGDAGGAERIATSMMPGGMASGLQPFFTILPTLPAADRAFAVHFGEVRTTSERAFDRRLVPPLAALGPDPTAPVVLAAVPPTVVPVRDERKRRRERRRNDIAAATIPPPVPLPQPPAYRPGVAAVPPAIIPARAAPVAVAMRAPVARAPVVPPPPVPTLAAPPVVAVSRATYTVRTTPPPAVAVIVAAPRVVVPPQNPIVVATAAPIVAYAPIASSPPVPAARAAAATPVRSEDSILASILNDLVVPSSELEGTVAAAAAPVPRPDPALAEHAEAEQHLADQKAAELKLADRKLADKKAADKKAADKKLADRKLADAKAAAEAKKAEEARKHDPKLLEPSRVWVQVAGGASEGDLAKAWTAVRAKAPAAFKGRSGWKTPLRATNRVLAGPFKSSEEAQSFVNTIAKDGIAGFVFTSTAGQKIDRLGTP